MKTLEEIDKEVREACIKANPEIMELYEACGYHFAKDYLSCNDCVKRERDIQLADVLLAIAENYKLPDNYAVRDDGSFIAERHPKDYSVDYWEYAGMTWNLRTDWDGQTEETKRFVHALIHQD